MLDWAGGSSLWGSGGGRGTPLRSVKIGSIGLLGSSHFQTLVHRNIEGECLVINGISEFWIMLAQHLAIVAWSAAKLILDVLS